MQFTRLEDLEVVTRITGVHHHFLGLRFSQIPVPGTMVVERVSLENPEPEIEEFDSQKRLYREVMNGVSEANERLGTHFGVIKIRYCVDDPPIPGIYYRLARALVEHFSQENGHKDETIDRIADEAFLEYDLFETSDGGS
jgi:hypothetical protein